MVKGAHREFLVSSHAEKIILFYVFLTHGWLHDAPRKARSKPQHPERGRKEHWVSFSA